jgi:hypothetical protein
MLESRTALNRHSEMEVSPVGHTGRREKRPFSPEEDARLTELVTQQQADHISWNDIERQMPERSARQCRERWNLYLCPEVANLPWTPEEDGLLIRLFQTFGPKWTLIAKNFSKRTPNNVKNRQKQMKRRDQRITLPVTNDSKDFPAGIAQPTFSAAPNIGQPGQDLTSIH